MLKRLSIFNKVNDKADHNSSDEDDGSKDDKDVSFLSGVSFKVYCIKTDKQKDFQIDFYRCLVKLSSSKKFSIFPCNNIQRIHINIEKNQVTVESKSPTDLLTTQRKYVFESIPQANKFKIYIERCKEHGNNIRYVFDLLDPSKQFALTANNIMRIAQELELSIAESEASLMLGQKDEMYFDTFFELCLNIVPLYSPRQTIMDWLHFVNEEKRVSESGDPVSRGWLGIDDSVLVTFPGEIKLGTVECMRWTMNSGIHSKYSLSKRSNINVFSGIVYVTNYRVVLMNWKRFGRSTVGARYDCPKFFDEITIPLNTIISEDLECDKLVITTKDNRSVQLRSLANNIEGLHTLLRVALANVANNVFAFRYRKMFAIEGWDYSDIRNEYQRIGLSDGRYWQIMDNSEWSIADLLPQHIVVPQSVGLNSIAEDPSLQNVCSRFPVVNYRHTGNGAVLARSVLTPTEGPVSLSPVKMDPAATDKAKSLPHVNGLYGPRSTEYILMALAESPRYFEADANIVPEETVNTAKLAVFNLDTVPKSKLMNGFSDKKAVASNRLEIIPCDLSDIYSVATAYSVLGDALLSSADDMDADANGFIVSRTPQATDIKNGYHLGVENSSWLYQCSQLLRVSTRIAEKLHIEGQSCLIQCKDGCDQTAQISSLVQIILDPYYRTFEGLASLIEKEWCSFGHKFQDRCGRGEREQFSSTTDMNERSPVFVQFLDALSQLLHQHPAMFEYSKELLVFLADHVYSGLYGTFLHNNQKLRFTVDGAHENTVSIWSYILTNRVLFSNSLYIKTAKALWLTTPAPIWPVCVVSRMVIWERYHARWYANMHPTITTGVEWHDNWGSGLETKENRLAAATSQYRFADIRKMAQSANESKSASHGSPPSAAAPNCESSVESEDANAENDESVDNNAVEYVDEDGEGKPSLEDQQNEIADDIMYLPAPEAEVDQETEDDHAMPQDSDNRSNGNDDSANKNNESHGLVQYSNNISDSPALPPAPYSTPDLDHMESMLVAAPEDSDDD